MQKLIALAVVVIILLAHETSVAQGNEYLTDCARGASFVSSAVVREDGSVILVGDLGRVGTYTKSANRIEWECLPTQSFLYGVCSWSDTTIVVGENGELWFRIGLSGWTRRAIPGSETLRTVTIHNGNVYVGSEKGSIWQLSDLNTGLWSLSYTHNAAIINLFSADGILLAVGKMGTLLQKSAEWVDLSLPNSTLEFACIAVVGDVYVIGADSGKVLRYDSGSNQWESVAISSTSTMIVHDDFRGRGDKTMSILRGPGGRLIASGNYDISAGTQGLRVSDDTGKNWRSVPFILDSNDPNYIYAWFCPSVGIYKDSILAVVCPPESPTTFFVSNASLQTFQQSFQSTDVYQSLDTLIGLRHGRTTGFVQSIAVLSPNAGYVTLQNSYATSWEYQTTLKAVTYVVSTLTEQDTVVHDTIAQLNGNYTTLFLHSGTLYAGGDSGRIATSVDGGLRWDVDTIHEANIDKQWIGRFFTEGDKLCVLLAGSTATVQGWYSRWIARQTDTGWYAAAVEAPVNNSVLPLDLDVGADGRSVVLALNVDAANKSHYAVYRYESDKYREISKVEQANGSSADIFIIGDTIGVTIMLNEATPSKAFYLRCLLIDNQWQCDTVMIKLATGIKKLTSGDLHFDHVHRLLVGDGAAGAVYSTDYGLTWKHLPRRKTFFGHILRVAVEDGGNIVVCGPNNFIARYSLDSTSTYVCETVLNTGTSLCSRLDENEGPSVWCAIYDLQGRLLTTLMYSGYASLAQAEQLRPGQLYVILPLNDKSFCPMIVAP